MPTHASQCQLSTRSCRFRPISAISAASRGPAYTPAELFGLRAIIGGDPIDGALLRVNVSQAFLFRGAMNQPVTKPPTIAIAIQSGG